VSRVQNTKTINCCTNNEILKAQNNEKSFTRLCTAEVLNKANLYNYFFFVF